MAFIEKKDPVVLNIKITSRGRELLSQGKLSFNYFAIGDSEIDYGFNSAVNSIDETANLPYKSLILRAADKNPNLLSFITQNNDNNYFNPITNVPSTTTIIQNTAQPIGFFSVNSSGSTTFLTDPDHVKQPDAAVKLSKVTGGTRLELYRSTTFGGNQNDPAAGDLILIKWINLSATTNTLGYTVDKTHPTPYLVYKIISVESGSTNHPHAPYTTGSTSPLSTLMAIVNVDRELPNFHGLGSNKYAGAMIYYNYINYTGDTIYNYYATDYLNQSVIAFLENAQCPTIRFPFWNMSIIFTDEIAGVKSTNRKYPQFNSREYGGFVSYIQNQAPVIKKMGVIHYTNQSPSNTYGEELFRNTPTLNIPTIMWHKSSSKQLGVVLKAYGSVKTLIGTTKSLNTTYYDLADLNGNIVGKIFNDLKLFVIEDQELLFAMSYKSNRSWTLPNYSVDINASVVYGCPDCTVTFDVMKFNPTTVGTNTGRLFIDNIDNTIGVAPDVDLVLSVSGLTHGNVYFEKITGNTLVDNLYADTYHVVIYDLRSMPSTCVGKTVTMYQPNSILSIYDLVSTDSGLNPDFPIYPTSVVTNTTTLNLDAPAQIVPTGAPTSVYVPLGTPGVFNSGIGTYYGTPMVGCKIYDGTPSDPTNFIPFSAGIATFNLTFNQTYTFMVKDTVISPANTFRVSREYVTVGTPFRNTFDTLRGSDAGGSYIIVSNYLTTITSTNPIIGPIEFTAYLPSGYPVVWETLPVGSPDGSAMKIYCSEDIVKITIREVTNLGILVADVSKTVAAVLSTTIKPT